MPEHYREKGRQLAHDPIPSLAREIGFHKLFGRRRQVQQGIRVRGESERDTAL